MPSLNAKVIKTPNKRLEWLITHVNGPLRFQVAILGDLATMFGILNMTKENETEARKAGWKAARTIRQVIGELEEIARHCEEL